MEEPERFFFLRFQKTGSTALTQLLRTQFGDAAVYRDLDSIPTGVPFPAHVRAALARVRVVFSGTKPGIAATRNDWRWPSTVHRQLPRRVMTLKASAGPPHSSAVVGTSPGKLQGGELGW